jgi:hypothetical protein
LEITLKPRIDSSENDNSVKEAVFCKVWIYT